MKQEKNIGVKLLTYFLALLLCTLLGSMAVIILKNTDSDSLLASQAISSTMMFIVPPILLYLFTMPRPMQQIGFKPITHWKSLLAGLAIMYVALPTINQLTVWNEAMQLPGFLSQIEEMMKDMEERARQLTEQMLTVDTIGGLFANLFVMALIPAVGEELTFRGVMQQFFVRVCRNAHVGILLSAAVFSAIHFQFYGFLPRMLLGIFLGYFFYTTQSLWVSILMHFLNNGTVVLGYFLVQKGIIDTDIDTLGSTSNPIVLISSAVLCILLIAYAWKKREKPLA